MISNLFDFDPKQDHGHLISAFGNVAAKGPASFHNNLVSNRSHFSAASTMKSPWTAG